MIIEAGKFKICSVDQQVGDPGELWYTSSLSDDRQGPRRDDGTDAVQGSLLDNFSQIQGGQFLVPFRSSVDLMRLPLHGKQSALPKVH